MGVSAPALSIPGCSLAKKRHSRRTAFMGLQSITIIDYSGADVNAPYYLRQYPHLDSNCSRYSCNALVGIVGLNCSNAHNCALDGVTMIATSGFEGASNHAPAVRVWEGGDGKRSVNPARVKGLTVMSSQLTGGNDALDAANRPVGSWVSRSAGGWTVVADGGGEAGPPNDARLTAAAQSPAGPGGEMMKTLSRSHALLVGVSGERNARLAVEATGAVRWGSGESDFGATLERLRTNSTPTGGLELAAGSIHRLTIAVEGAERGDVCTATHAGLTEEAVFVSCRVARKGECLALLKNEEAAAAHVPAGELRVVVAAVR